MDHERFTLLFARIRERCRQLAQHPEHFSDFERLAACKQGALEISTGLPWPPATATQLEATEAQLGFPLPSLLRALYAEVGNGGFGPGYGIVGVVGGAPHISGWFEDVAEGYTQAERFVDLETLPAIREHGKWVELAEGEWPRYLIPFCYWGCNTMHALSAQTGEVFVVESGRFFANWVPSLEDWLEQWLAGTLAQE